MGCCKIDKHCWQWEELQGLLVSLSLVFLEHNLEYVICKQQASNKPVIIGRLVINPWIINTLGVENKERLRYRAALFSRPPGELFRCYHLSQKLFGNNMTIFPDRCLCVWSMRMCMKYEWSEVLQANEQYFGEGQTFTISSRLAEFSTR